MINICQNAINQSDCLATNLAMQSSLKYMKISMLALSIIALCAIALSSHLNKNLKKKSNSLIDKISADFSERNNEIHKQNIKIKVFAVITAIFVFFIKPFFVLEKMGKGFGLICLMGIKAVSRPISNYYIKFVGGNDA